MPVNSKRQSGTSTKTQSARELWLQAVKNRSPGLNGLNRSNKGFSTAKKSSSEYWIGSLRKGTGFQNEIASMDTFGRNGRPSDDSIPYFSTSHYLRERVGIEKTTRNKRSPSADSRAPPGTPSYKTPEEYYDEVLELRKQLGTLDKDNSTLRAKLRRVEEDNLKKEKELEGLLDPTKSGDLRRTLTDRKSDASAVVHSMKQKILKLEQQLKEKEQALSSLKADVKATNIEELRMKIEMFYQEITRLQNQKSSGASQQRQHEKRSAKNWSEGKESSSKLKALNETILRMNEKNVRLTSENKTLMEDLEKLMNQTAEAKEKQREYEDMNRRQLTGVIAKLEKRLEKQEADNTSLHSLSVGTKADTSGKLQLEGSMAQRLECLDKRETELLSEIKHQQGIIKKLKDEKQHYRQKTDDRIKEIKALKKEIDELQNELDITNRNDYVPVLTQHSSQNRSKSARSNSRKEREQRIKEFRENHAAKTIQRGWREHNSDQAALLIQSAARGNRSRKQQISRYLEEEKEEELSDAAELIQSSVRGHWNRQRYNRERSVSTDRGSSRSHSHNRNDVDYDTDEAATYIQSSIRGHNSRKQYLASNSSRPSSARSSASAARSNYASPKYYHHGRKKSLDSAGEDEIVSDEVVTPRQKRNSVMRSKSRSTIPLSDEEDDDDDIMF